ncbi:hypothetical protein, partial [Mesorhizobium sp. M1A.F.Ca.IN.020.03.2.1]|uniref:hypothetical protein n=1 Tax=Mesorhizobium sp. M1A.F.Ca.IN.020.03.2.1 TaxID=2496769 RepID=UPI0019D48C2A
MLADAERDLCGDGRALRHHHPAEPAAASHVRRSQRSGQTGKGKSWLAAPSVVRRQGSIIPFSTR